MGFEDPDRISMVSLPFETGGKQGKIHGKEVGVYGTRHYPCDLLEILPEQGVA